jgi:hypothetical protein
MVMQNQGDILMTHHAVVGAFSSNTKANNAVLDLQKMGFDIQKLSLAKIAFPSNLLPPHMNAGFPPDQMQATSVSLTLVGAAEAGVLINPGVDPVMIAGPLASKLANWAETAMVNSAAFPGRSGLAVSLLATGLSEGLGVPQHKALQYEIEIRAGKFVLLVSGSHEEINQARQILQNAKYSASEVIQDPGTEGINDYPSHSANVHSHHPPLIHPYRSADGHPPHLL